MILRRTFLKCVVAIVGCPVDSFVKITGRKGKILKVGRVLRDGTLTGWAFSCEGMVVPVGGWPYQTSVCGYSINELRQIARSCGRSEVN